MTHTPSPPPIEALLARGLTFLEADMTSAILLLVLAPESGAAPTGGADTYHGDDVAYHGEDESYHGGGE